MASLRDYIILNYKWPYFFIIFFTASCFRHNADYGHANILAIENLHRPAINSKTCLKCGDWEPASAPEEVSLNVRRRAPNLCYKRLVTAFRPYNDVFSSSTNHILRKTHLLLKVALHRHFQYLLVKPLNGTSLESYSLNNYRFDLNLF